ncbi:MAG: glycosyltransferase family 4 protein [Methanophagales archaeon]|nr:glycosyltransferase family 4 protein [Methanophagales archaeon]
MRIICISTWFFDYIIQLANALSKKNSVMLVIPANKLPRVHSGSIDKKVDFQLLGRGKPLYHPTNILILKDFIKKMNEFKPDVIHFQAGGIVNLALLPFLKKYPLVATFHDVILHTGENNWRQNFIRYCARKYSNHIIVHGEKLKEQMIKEYNIPNKKVNAIPIGEHGVEPFKKYEREDLKEDGNLILFFGRIYKYKGLEYLIKAEPMITKEVQDAKIVIAGTGDDFKKYEKMMVNKDNFIISNHYIPYKEGAELFQRCNVVVLPYIDASQSGVIPTAYGFKKPVIVTDVGSVPEIVDEGLTGFIVPSKDPEALAEAIVKLLQDEDLRKQMGENAYKKLKTDLSWDKIVEKTIEVYEKAINESKKEGIK